MITTSTGEWASLTMDGGWKVVLAPNSLLSFSPADTVTGQQTVELRGDARFTLTTPGALAVVAGPVVAMAQDPGAQFMVRSYPEDTLTQVASEAGVLAVTHRTPVPGSSDSLSVFPGYRALATERRFISLGSEATRWRPEALPGFARRGMGLVTVGLGGYTTPLSEVVSTFQDLWDVTIELEPPSLGNLVLTARWQGIDFPSEDVPADSAGDIPSLAEHLQFIAAALDLSVLRTGPRAFTLRRPHAPQLSWP